jgi:hypothetical protein
VSIAACGSIYNKNISYKPIFPFLFYFVLYHNKSRISLLLFFFFFFFFFIPRTPICAMSQLMTRFLVFFKKKKSSRNSQIGSHEKLGSALLDFNCRQ